MGNHLLENGFGLACAGAATRGPEADVWWQAGMRLLEWQLPAQFLEDGGHIERSASYHLALTHALLETIELSEASPRRVPAILREIASRALGWANAVRAPDGTYPLFNDAALDAAPSIDEVLSLGKALGLFPASITQVDGSHRLRITRLADTGWVRMDAEGACLFIDAGPDADGWQPGHAHADGLTFEMWIDGVRSVVDFGVASYGYDSAREETRATKSHNTVELGGRDSCEVWAAFRVGRRGRGIIKECSVKSGLARVLLEHDGYAWRPHSPRHERTLELGGRRLFIRDQVRGSTEPWVSRVRMDARAADRIRISGTNIERKKGRWHLRHAEAQPAIVLEQKSVGHTGYTIDWSFEW